jgi:hypothetical protein
MMLIAQQTAKAVVNKRIFCPESNYQTTVAHKCLEGFKEISSAHLCFIDLNIFFKNYKIYQRGHLLEVLCVPPNQIFKPFLIKAQVFTHPSVIYNF